MQLLTLRIRDLVRSVFIQILDCYEYRLQQFANSAKSFPHDILRLVCRLDCVAGTAVWLEGSGLHEAHRGTALHGITGCCLSGNIAQENLSIYLFSINGYFCCRYSPRVAPSMCHCWSSCSSTGRSI